MRGVAEEKRITDAHRLVGIRLILHRNAGTGRCDPSYKALAAEVGVDRSTAIRAAGASFPAIAHAFL